MSSSRSLLREYVEALLIAVLFAVFARTFVVQAFKIPTGSMEENLLVGDHILVNKFVFGPTLSSVERLLIPTKPIRRGDVAVFKYPEDPSRDFIKRCIGLPGDEIKIMDKVIFVNGDQIDEGHYAGHTDPNVYPGSLFLDENHRYRDNFGPYTVPEGHYFFLGDNRDNSNDSRFWGPVAAELIKGRAFMIYWSFDTDLDSSESRSYGNALKELSTVFLRFFTHTRWERSFRIVR